MAVFKTRMAAKKVWLARGMLVEFFEQREHFLFDFYIRKPVFALVEQHHGVGFARPVVQMGFVKPIAFPQHALVIIAVYGMPEIFFGN